MMMIDARAVHFGSSRLASYHYKLVYTLVTVTVYEAATWELFMRRLPIFRVNKQPNRTDREKQSPDWTGTRCSDFWGSPVPINVFVLPDTNWYKRQVTHVEYGTTKRVFSDTTWPVVLEANNAIMCSAQMGASHNRPKM
jgi:hypothetical protein